MRNFNFLVQYPIKTGAYVNCMNNPTRAIPIEPFPMKSTTRFKIGDAIVATISNKRLKIYFS